MQFLITKVDTDLLKAIVIKDLKSSNIQYSNELNPLHGGVNQCLITLLNNELESSLIQRPASINLVIEIKLKLLGVSVPGNTSHRVGGLADSLALGHPLHTNLQLGL